MKIKYIRKDFTATLEIGKYISFTGNIDGSSGACGDRIAEKDSDFEIMNKMHLADPVTGAPMHAWANAKYFAKEGNLPALTKHLRVSEEQALAISGAMLNSIGAEASVQECVEVWHMKHCFSNKRDWYEKSKVEGETLSLAHYDEYVRKYTTPILHEPKCTHTWEVRILPGEKLDVTCPKCSAKGLKPCLIELKNACRFSADEVARRLRFKEIADKKLVDLQGNISENWLRDLDELEEAISDIPVKDTEHWIMDEECDEKQNVLGEFLDCPADDVEVSSYDEHLHEAEGGEYLVLDKWESEERAEEAIRELVWAFNANFLQSYMSLDEENIQKLQESCEVMNDAFIQLIGDNWDSFVADALGADGIGHFLSQYDGHEHVQGEFFIYRVN